MKRRNFLKAAVGFLGAVGIIVPSIKAKGQETVYTHSKPPKGNFGLPPIKTEGASDPGPGYYYAWIEDNPAALERAHRLGYRNVGENIMPKEAHTPRLKLVKRSAEKEREVRAAEEYVRCLTK